MFVQSEALEAGVTLRQLQHRVRRGLLDHIEPGVYRIAATPVTWEQRVQAACLTEGALASHRTAAALWPLDGARPGIVEVLTDRWKRRPNRSFRLHETTLLDDADRAELRGIPLTSKARTVVDLAAVVPPGRVELALDTPGVELDEVWACIERLDGRGRPWVKIARRLVAARLERGGAVAPNLFERLLYEILERANLPLPEPQVEIRRADGTLIGRVDWCYPRQKVILECDSYRFHNQWIRRKADIRRDRELTALGYRVLRFSWEDLIDHEACVVRDVVGALDVSA